MPDATAPRSAATNPSQTNVTDEPALFPSLTNDGLLDVATLPGRPGEPPRSWDGVDDLLTSTYANASLPPVWIHLDRTQASAKAWLHQLERDDEPVLPPSTADALLAEETRPRGEPRAVDHAGGHTEGLLVILRGINLNPGAEPDELIALRMWIDPRLAITLRQFRFRTLRELREQIRAGTAPETTGSLLVAIAQGLTRRLADSVENLRQLLDECEAAALSLDEKDVPDPSDKGANLSATRMTAEIRRQAIRLRRYLAPQRDALHLLSTTQTASLDDADRAALRELSQQTARFVDDLEELRDRASVTQDELRAVRERAAQRTEYLLALVAAVFLPLGFATGLLGINVGGIPGANTGWAFWGVCVALLTCTALMITLFKRWRWL